MEDGENVVHVDWTDKKEYRETMVSRERKATSVKKVPGANAEKRDQKASSETRVRRENQDSPDKTE